MAKTYLFSTLTHVGEQQDAELAVREAFAQAKANGSDPVIAAANACKRIRRSSIMEKRPADLPLQEVIIEISKN